MDGTGSKESLLGAFIPYAYASHQCQNVSLKSRCVCSAQVMRKEQPAARRSSLRLTDLFRAACHAVRCRNVYCTRFSLEKRSISGQNSLICALNVVAYCRCFTAAQLLVLALLDFGFRGVSSPSDVEASRLVMRSSSPTSSSFDRNKKAIYPNAPWDCHICRSVGVVWGVVVGRQSYSSIYIYI